MGATSNRSDRRVAGELSTTTAGSGVTQTVGHDAVDRFYYTVADVSTNVADCTTDSGTISAPGAWTDIVDFDIGEPIDVDIGVGIPASSVYPIHLVVDAAEDANDAIRLQVIIDDVTVADVTATKDASDVNAVVYGPVQTEYTADYDLSYKFHCNSSFKIRATRNGTFADATTKIVVGAATYHKFQ